MHMIFQCFCVSANPCKEMAAKAKRAWEQLRQQRDGTVYIQHAPAAQQWAAKAADLAARGKTGEQVYMLWPA